MNAEELLTHASFVRALARSLVLDDHQAADVEQQTWLAALEHSPDSNKSVRSWLHRVVRNFAYRLHRTEKRRARHERDAPPPPDPPSSEEVVIRGEAGRRLIEAVLRLEEPGRSAILFRYYEDMPPREIARHLSVPVATVYTRLKRGLSQLRDSLDAVHGGSRKKWMTALAPLAGLKLKAASAMAATAAGPLVLGAKMKAGLSALLFLAACFTLVQFFPEQENTLEEEGGGAPSTASAPLGFMSNPSEAGDVPREETVRESLVASAPEGKLVLSGRIVNLSDLVTAEGMTPASNIEIRFASSGKSPSVEDRPGERVRALGYSTPSPAQTGTAMTDAQGRFSFECEDSGTRPLSIQLTVDHDEVYRMCLRTLKVKKNQWEVGDLILARSPHGTLTGRTVGPHGEALAGVRVLVLSFSTLYFGHTGNDDEPLQEGEALEVISDAQGFFQFYHFKEGYGVEARSAGYRQVDVTPLSRIETGGWEPTRITLTPVGSLVLRVVDSEGGPVQGVEVRVDVSSAEKEARRTPQFVPGESRKSLAGKTGADGSLLFPEVWAEKKLLFLLGYEGNIWHAEWMKGGRVVYERSGDARAMVVAPREGLDIDIPLPPCLEILGRVLFPDGAPAPGALLTLEDPEVGLENPYLHGIRVYADEEGYFKHTIRTHAPPESLFVTVTQDPDASRQSALYKTSGVLHPGEGPVELVLEATQMIQGRVRDENDRPVQGRIHARSQDSENPWEGFFHGSSSSLNENGEFSIGALIPGNYRLTVFPDRDKTGTGSSMMGQDFHHISAGQTSLDLILQKPELVRIGIEVRAGEKEQISAVYPAVFRLHPRHPIASQGAISPEFMEVHRYDGWPTAATLHLGTRGSVSKTESGLFEGRYLEKRETKQFDLEPVCEGWYCIAVRTHGEGGIRFYPTGTGFVYLAPGDYHFRFVLDRMGELEGRLHGKTLRDDLCVALVDESGRAVHTLWNEEYYARVSRTGADGTFFLQGVPVGRFYLRVGTEQELKAGKYRHKQQVIIEEGENPFLDIYVP